MADLLKFKLVHGGCTVPGPYGIRHAKSGDVVELTLADAARIEGEDISTQHLEPLDPELEWSASGPVAKSPEPKKKATK